MTPQAPNPTVTDGSPTITGRETQNISTHSPTQSPPAPPAYTYLYPLHGRIVSYVASTAGSVTSLLPAYSRDAGPPGYPPADIEANQGSMPTMISLTGIPVLGVYRDTAVNNQNESPGTSAARNAKTLKMLLALLLTAAVSGGIALAFVIPKMHHSCSNCA